MKFIINIFKILINLFTFFFMLPFVTIGFTAHVIKMGLQRGYEMYDDFIENMRIK